MSAGPSQQPNISPSVPSPTNGASAQVPHEIPAQSRSIPKFGNLNSKPHLYYLTSLSAPQLLFITQTAPDHLRRTISPQSSAQVLLDEVFRLRQIESSLPQNRNETHQENARTLSQLSPTQIIGLSQDDPIYLRRLMQSTLLIDTTLSPSTLPDDNSLCATYAISWKLAAVQRLSAAAQNQQRNAAQVMEPQRDIHRDQHRLISRASPPNPPAPTGHLQRLLQDAPPPPRPNTEREDSEDEDAMPRQKKSKFSIEPRGWSAGHGPALKTKLQSYPGKGLSSTALAVEEILGPELLLHMTSGGMDIPTYVRSIGWTRPYNNKPFPSENEAVTLARMIHLELLIHQSPWEALEQRPSLEVGLRRLYALIHVEMASRQTAVYPSRAHAWTEIEPILEVTPSQPLHSPSVADTITKYMTLHKKRIQAMKAINTNSKTKSFQNRPQLPNKPKNTQTNAGQQQGE